MYFYGSMESKKLAALNDVQNPAILNEALKPAALKENPLEK